MATLAAAKMMMGTPKPGVKGGKAAFNKAMKVGMPSGAKVKNVGKGAKRPKSAK